MESLSKISLKKVQLKKYESNKSTKLKLNSDKK